MYREIISGYFNAWISGDTEIIKQTFGENAVYTESYGPEYHGLNQILRWYNDWNSHGRVMCWDLADYYEQGNTAIVRWYFKCKYDGETSAFDGVTIAEFDENMKIARLCEYQSKAEHNYPYGE